MTAPGLDPDRDGETVDPPLDLERTWPYFQPDDDLTPLSAPGGGDDSE